MADKPRIVPGGLLIIFEGIDGVGKTTQLELADTALKETGWQVHCTRNLGGTPIGEELRKVIKTQTERPTKTNLYISVAIQEALIGAIADARKQGNIILMDRGPLSLAAYEIYGSHLDESLGWKYVEAGMKEFGPELTIIYNADVKVALDRLKYKDSQTDYFESKSLNYFKNVARGYDLTAKKYKSKVVKIDAEQPIETIHDQTMAAIEKTLARKIKSLNK